MAKNANLAAAKKAKNDEFYTQITDIEKELVHYHDQLKGTIVFCNCDDPTYSNFWRYFHLNFAKIGLKKLISTHFDPEKPTYKLEYEGGADEDWSVGKLTVLSENGDFRSPECVQLLQECDVVVTNPPFSLFREYVAQLMQYGKKFIIIGNKNAVKYRDFFPFLKNGQVWIGYGSPCEFGLPDGTVTKSVSGLNRWFTNIDIKKRHDPMTLFRRYYDDPSKYPKFDHYDAIDVSKTDDIPEDYTGIMAVPITFLDKYCSDQFEIIDLLNRYTVMDALGRNAEIQALHSHSCNINGVAKFSRILIRRVVNSRGVMRALDDFNRSSGVPDIEYDEYFAKNILCRQLGLQDIVVSDKPDLRCTFESKHIGIEVTSAVDPEYRIARKFSSLDGNILNVKHGLQGNAKHAVDAVYPIKSENGELYRTFNLDKLNPRLAGRHVRGYVQDAYEAKCAKLSGYADMDEYWLFIYFQPGLLVSIEDVLGLCEYFTKRSLYRRVFLFNDWDFYDCASGSYTYTPMHGCVKYIADNTTIEIAHLIGFDNIFG